MPTFLLGLVGVLAVAAVALARQRGWLDAFSIAVLAILAIPVSLLARYDIDYAVWFWGRPYWLIFAVQGAIAIACWLVYVLGGRRGNGRAVAPLLKAACLFVAIVVAVPVGGHLLSPTVGIQPFDWGAWLQSIVLWSLPLLAGCALMLNVRLDDRKFERLILVFAAITAVVSVANLLSGFFRQYVDLLTRTRMIRQEGRSFTPLGHPVPNSLVMYLGFTICLARALACRQRRLGYLIVCCLALAGTVMTLTRSTLLAMAATGLILLSRSAYRGWTALMAGLLALTAAAVIHLAPTTLNVSRLWTKDDRSIDMRTQSLLSGIELARARPVLGHGFGQVYDQFFYRYGYYAPEMLTTHGVLTTAEPHNGYLLVWVEAGLPGLAAVCLLLYLLWRGLAPNPGITAQQRQILFGFRMMTAGAILLIVTTSDLFINHRVVWIFWTYAAAGIAYNAFLRRTCETSKPSVDVSPSRGSDLANASSL